MSHGLTPDQLAIVSAREPNVAVRAGAGAGKTRVLVDRYLEYVNRGYSVEEIVAITFTRKAAEEMRQRIGARFRVAGHPELAVKAEIANIMTVHSFCKRVLTESAPLANLDPEFGILGTSETEMQKAFESVLADLEASPEIEYLMNRIPGRRHVTLRSAHGVLQKSISDFLSSARQSGRGREWFLENYGTKDAVLSTWRRLLPSTMPEGVRQVVSDPFDVSQYPKQTKGGFVQVLREGKQDFEAQAMATSGLIQIACQTWLAFDRSCAKQQQFDYSDLEYMTLKLLEESPQARNRIQNTFKVLMIDEGQDVNPVQFRIIKALGAKELFMVGDPFQAIFGFRGTDFRYFQQFTEEATRYSLMENHRSQPEVLRFIQKLFRQIWSDRDYEPMRVPSSRELTVGLGKCTVMEVSQAEDYESLADEIAKARADNPDAEIAVLARRASYLSSVESALRDRKVSTHLPRGRKAYYSRLEIRDVANLLRALSHPADDLAVVTALRSPFCGISMDAVVALSQSKPVWQALALAELAAEDRKRVDEFLGWAEPLKARIDRIPVAETLAEVFAVSRYWEAIASLPNGKWRLANIRKLIKLAAERPTDDARTFAEHIRQIQGLSTDEVDASLDEETNSVRFETLHSAKGLEWDIVFLLLECPLNLNRETALRYDQELDLVHLKLSDREGLALLLRERSDLREREEVERLIYVGMTRARQQLFVQVAKNSKSAGEIVRKHVLTKTAPWPEMEHIMLGWDGRTSL